MFAGFDRVDRLTRHAEPPAKLCLAPVAFGAQHFQPVLHGQDECTRIAVSEITTDTSAPNKATQSSRLASVEREHMDFSVM